MNIGSLVPQIVYYVYAYAQLVKTGEIAAGDKVNFTVPTGNFGNILAAYYAKQIGLPVGKLICASNDNNVLTDFFSTGVYDKNRTFRVTTSPSMDILVSSNLERLIFHLFGNDAVKTAELMEALNTAGQYDIQGADADILSLFPPLRQKKKLPRKSSVSMRSQTTLKIHTRLLPPLSINSMWSKQVTKLRQ